MAKPASPPSDDPETLRALLVEAQAENERLRQNILAMRRHRFGRRAESLPEDQLLLGLEEAEQVEAAGLAAEESESAKKVARVAKRQTNRGALPAHLPRVETLVDIASTACPCCAGSLHKIGEDVSERLDVVPGRDPWSPDRRAARRASGTKPAADRRAGAVAAREARYSSGVGRGGPISS